MFQPLHPSHTCVSQSGHSTVPINAPPPPPPPPSHPPSTYKLAVSQSEAIVAHVCALPVLKCALQ